MAVTVTHTDETFADGQLVKSSQRVVDITAETNRTTIQAQAAQALLDNRTFVALTAPTTAQTVAHVKALARQNNSIIRLLLNQLEGTD